MSNKYQFEEALRLINNVDKKKELGKLQYIPQTLFSLANRVLTDAERRIFYFYVASGEGTEDKPFKPATAFICKETQIHQKHFHKYRQQLASKGFLNVNLKDGTVEVNYDSIKKMMDSKPNKEKGKQRGKWMDKPTESDTTNSVVTENDDWEDDTTANSVVESTTNDVVVEAKSTTKSVAKPTTKPVGIISKTPMGEIRNKENNTTAAGAADGRTQSKPKTDSEYKASIMFMVNDILKKVQKIPIKDDEVIKIFTDNLINEFGISYEFLYSLYAENFVFLKEKCSYAYSAIFNAIKVRIKWKLEKLQQQPDNAETNFV